VSAKGFEGKVLRPPRLREATQLGRHKDFFMTVLEKPPNQLFAATKPVDICGIEKVNTILNRGPKCQEGIFLGNFSPLGAA
jgi:hypothetical protein